MYYLTWVYLIAGLVHAAWTWHHIEDGLKTDIGVYQSVGIPMIFTAIAMLTILVVAVTFWPVFAAHDLWLWWKRPCADDCPECARKKHQKEPT